MTSSRSIWNSFWYYEVNLGSFQVSALGLILGFDQYSNPGAITCYRTYSNPPSLTKNVVLHVENVILSTFVAFVTPRTTYILN